MKLRYLSRILLLLLTLLAASCRDDDDASGPSQDVKTYKVVVMAEESALPRWQRTGQWALQNFAEAQKGLPKQVRLELEMKSQDDVDLIEYTRKVADDSSIVAIVGPTISYYAELVGKELAKSHKVMITPCATNVEFQRKFADVDYVWNMSESYIAQLEIMLLMAESYEYEKVCLLSQGVPGAEDGQNSFEDWFGYIAEEIGIEVGGIMMYETYEQLDQHVQSLCSTTDTAMNKVFLLFCPDDNADAIVFDQALTKAKSQAGGRRLYYPSIMCSDGFMNDLSQSALINDDYEGLVISDDPESGFHQAYELLFGQQIGDGEPQYYDALMLLTYALTYKETMGGTLPEAIKAVVDGTDGYAAGWLPMDIADNYVRLRKGETPELSGACGRWIFDQQTHASIVGSSYRHWKMMDDELKTLRYLSTTGTSRTTSFVELFSWKAQMLEIFDFDTEVEIKYPKKDDNWAVLVAASGTYTDYRFQADMMSMYQMLRRYGYDDDHIIVIADDDIATDSRNKYPGELRTSLQGENVYSKEAIDYHISDLSMQNLGDILKGNASQRLPTVMQADADDNVFVFWSGHGTIGGLRWGEKVIPYKDMRKYLEAMTYRKLFMAVEACYSGGLGEACVGLPKALIMTAATPYETSKAAVWNPDLQVYMSNGFTHGFREAVDKDPNVSLRDLYYSLARNTTGSHVKVYNEKNYGSVYTNSMGEWLKR